MAGPEDKLGNPDIELGTLQIWIHGREFPDSMDYWDGNWLQITAHCSALGADVWTNGPFLRVPDIAGWIDACERLYKTFQGEAYLGGIEPEFAVTLMGDKLGHVTMSVDITPQYLTQRHTLKFDLDQSCLPTHISACRVLLDKYPMRGKPDSA